MEKINPHPLVSIIIPVYKVEKYLATCLDSLINQTLKNWEAILVDDGSPDSSGKICDEYANADDRFKVLHKKNGGLSSARNAAMPHVNGEYVTFLDSDDFLHKVALEELYRIAKENDADIVQCDFIRGSEKDFPESIEKEVLRKFDNHSIFTNYATKVITWGKLYRAAIIKDIRFPEGLVNEDDFTTWKFYYKAKNIVVTSKKYYYYTVNPTSIMANQKRKPDLRYFDAYRERIAFFQDTKEKDLEAVSRIHWMKSLVMIFANPELESEQKKKILQLFFENYNSLLSLNEPVPTKLLLIFRFYRLFPTCGSKLVNTLYRQR